MLNIEAVKEGGAAQRSGLRENDALVSIDGNPVRDVIDFMYHTDSDSVAARARREAECFDVRLKRDEDGVFGLRFEPLKPLTCSNRCIFCFIDQLPGDMRKTLYVKDEDYRLSFLHGSFITMSNLGPAAMSRIAEQSLSPLYVSVHTTNSSLRARMLGVSKGADVLPKLRALKEAGVSVHAQVVLCPGINDGRELDKTVSELAELFPAVKSLAVVPVGLTKFRHGLPAIEAVDAEAGARLLASVSGWQRDFLRRVGSRFVFAADEFYLLADAAIPSEEEYEDFAQMENGVGLLRLFLERVDSLKERIRRGTGGRPAAVLTGKLTEAIWEEALGDGRERVIGVTNDFLGRSITVSGLLTGRDLLAAMRSLGPDEVAVIPESCLNHDGLFLDDMCPGELEKLSGHAVVVEGTGDKEVDSDYCGSAKRGEVHAFQ
jgi:putative radical SAM enzyme (TIGR03279 family)